MSEDDTQAAGSPIVIGDSTRHGLWCDGCQLPSVYELPVFILEESGVRSAGAIHPCENCSMQGEEAA